MGLDKETRITGLYWAIKYMVKFSNELKVEDKTFRPEKLISLIDQLWFSFLGKKHNNDFWIFDSDSSNSVNANTINPWGIAINYHCQDIFKKKEDFTDDFKDIEIDELLINNKLHYNIFKIFKWNEQATYYLRRYDDDLLEGLTPLSKTISDIHGECFSLFIEYDIYTIAYVLYMICNIICNKEDTLTNFLKKECNYHSLNNGMNMSLKELANIHIELKNKQTIFQRTKLFLKISGRKFHYDNKFKELLNLKFNENETKELKLLFNKCKEAYKKHNEDLQNNFKKSKPGPLNIYGYQFDK